MRNKENQEDYSYRRTGRVYGIAGKSVNKIKEKNEEREMVRLAIFLLFSLFFCLLPVTTHCYS